MDAIAVKDQFYLTEWAQPVTDSAITAANGALTEQFALSVPRYGRIVTVTVIDIDDDTLASTVHIFTSPFIAAATLRPATSPSREAKTPALGRGRPLAITTTLASPIAKTPACCVSSVAGSTPIHGLPPVSPDSATTRATR